MSVSLTPAQEHFLKKELLSLQLTREINSLAPTYNDYEGLRRFGPPFAMYDPKKPPLHLKEVKEHALLYSDYCESQFPLTKHIFNHYIVTFPFIYNHLQSAGSKDAFWIDKVQRFYEIWKSKKISNSTDRGSTSKSKLLIQKVIAAIIMYFNTGILSVLDEKYLAEDQDTRNLYKKVGKIVKSEITLEDVVAYEDDYVNDLDVNIIGVTTEKVTKNVRSFFFLSEQTKNVYEFIIRVKRQSTGKVTYVKRRYSEFVSFDKKLGKKFSGHNIPFLPSKNKSNTGIDLSNGTNDENQDEELDEGSVNDMSMMSAIDSLENNFLNSIKLSSDNKDWGSGATKLSSKFGLKKSTDSSFKTQPETAKFPREKTRIALRGYLRSLLRIKVVCNSSLFLNFIQEGAFEELAPEETKDAQLREKLDNLVVIQQFRFQQETIHAIEAIQKAFNEMKHEILENKRGLYYLFDQLKEKPSSKELTEPVQAFIQLAQIEVAATLYEIFIGNDNSMANLRMMKTFHAFFPYTVIATIMRFTNPLQVVKKLIDLFMYQMPIGFKGKKTHSLMQILFTGSLNDELKKIDKELDLISTKLMEMNRSSDYKKLVTKLEEYSTCSEETVLSIKKNSHYYKIDLTLSVLLNNNGLSTKIGNDVLVKVIKSYKNWLQLEELVKDEGDTINGEINRLVDQAELYSTLHSYFITVLNKNDKLRVVELWDEPEMMDLMKELVAIFFQPLIKLFKDAQLYLYLPILQKYVTELISLIEHFQNDYNALLNKSNNVVSAFMGLQSKYQEDLYTFIRNLYISDYNSTNQVFTGFIQYFNSFIKFFNYVKEGRPDLKINLSEMINNFPDDQLDKEVLIKQVNKIVDEIVEKRKKYEAVSTEVAEKSGLELENSKEVMAMGRKKALTKNWNNINNKITEQFQDFTESHETSPGGLIGIKDGDLMDLNIDFYDLTENNKFESIFYTMSGSEVVKYIVEHHDEVESDEDFKKRNEFGELKDNEEISKLSDTFKEEILAVLKSFHKDNLDL